MSHPGPYPPGNPYPNDPQATPTTDPWAQPAASPFPATSTPGSEYAAPVSGANYSVPVSGAEYSVPVSGAEYSVPTYPQPTSTPPGPVPPPASGPPAGYPTAPIPQGTPYATGPIPQGAPYATAPLPGATEVGPSGYGRPSPGKNRLVVILGAATALLLVVGLTMTGLFVAKNGEQNDTAAKLAASENTVRERDAKISTLEKDLTDTKTELTNTKQQLDGTKDSLGTANSDKQIIAQCLKLVIEALDAIGDGDKAKTDSLIKQLDEPCTKAEKLI